MQSSARILRDRIDACPRVVLVGVGALGSAVAHTLVHSDVTLRWSFLVVDADVLTPENLPNSVLFSGVHTEGFAALGAPKAEIVCAYAQRRGRSGWSARVLEIADAGWQELAASDVVVSCTDSALARLETTLVCRWLGIPVLDTGTQADGQSGQISWFAASAESPCYSCGLRAARRAEILAYALSPALHCGPLAPADPMGEHAAVPSLAAKIAQRVLRELGLWAQGKSQETSWSERLTSRQDGSWGAEKLQLRRAVSCPFHEQDTPEFVSLRADVPLGRQLPGPGWCFELPWPVNLQSRCRQCGAGSDKPTRLAALRRNALCLRCGAADAMESMCSVNEIYADSAVAGWTPQQLGLPPRHGLCARRRIDKQTWIGVADRVVEDRCEQ